MMAKVATGLIGSKTSNPFVSQILNVKYINYVALCNSVLAIWEVLLST